MEKVKSRNLVWFSCGIASAVAAKLSVGAGECEVLYCDTLKYEHPDNMRFLNDISKWIGQEIKILKSEKYKDIYDVFNKTGWLVGPGGARCTTELKKNVRRAYERPDDIHTFGFTSEEAHRIERLRQESPELNVKFPLYESGLSKKDCESMIASAGIEIPAMYKLGYKNNNCIGCVKGGAGYWNNIRQDFPEAFEKMAKQERLMGVTIIRQQIKGKKVRVFLDELPPDAGHGVKEPDIECGVLCIHEKEESDED